MLIPYLSEIQIELGILDFTWKSYLDDKFLCEAKSGTPRGELRNSD